jgi:hypothetical protein
MSQNSFVGTHYAVCQAERTGDNSLILLLSTIDKKQELKTLEQELVYGSTEYKLFFNDFSIENVVSIVKAEVLNFKIRFEKKNIAQVEQYKTIYQQKQAVVFSSGAIERIVLAKAKTVSKEPLQVPVWKTPAAQPVQPVQQYVQQQHVEPVHPVSAPVKQVQVSGIQCEGAHSIPYYLTKHEADFCRQNVIKAEGHKFCIKCIIANQDKNK